MSNFYSCGVYFKSNIIGKKFFKRKPFCFKASTYYSYNIKASSQKEATEIFQTMINDIKLDKDIEVNLKDWQEYHTWKVTSDYLIYDFLRDNCFIDLSKPIIIEKTTFSEIYVYELKHEDTIKYFTTAEIFDNE